MIENELQTVGGGEPKRSGIPFVVVQTSGMLVNDVGRDGIPITKILNHLRYPEVCWLRTYKNARS